jgi:hypothetical protein
MTDGPESENEVGAAAVAAPGFRVMSGNPTPAELAAVTAVLSAALEEATALLVPAKEQGQSAWQLAQRPIRMPLARGIGTWRSFSG